MKNTNSKDIKLLSVKVDLNDTLKNFSKEKQYTIPVFIPHLGCKNDCIFCNQKKISGNIEPINIDEIDKTIEENLSFFKDKDRKIQIAFFGGSFTGINIKEQIEYLKVANKYIEKGMVDSIRISTRPDYINIEILKLLKKFNVKTIELGVQSMDDRVLELSKRGHTARQVRRAARLIKLFRFELGIQIMTGLYGSDINQDVSSVKKVLKLKPEVMRIYPVYVIENSELYDMCLNGDYTPLSVEDAVIRVYLMMKEIQKTDVRIIRIGLQSSEEITQNNVKVLGPVSDNFAEYVMSELVLDKLEETIDKRIAELKKDKNYNDGNFGEIELVVVGNTQMSVLVGPKKINKTYLEEKYKSKIRFKVKG